MELTQFIALIKKNTFLLVTIVVLSIVAPFQKSIEQQIDLRAFQNIDITSKIIEPRTVFQGTDLRNCFITQFINFTLCHFY